MDVEQLIGTMIQGTLLGGGKRSHGARRFMRSGGQSFITASTLLTVGGLVWGAIETMQQQRTAAPGGSTPASPVPTAGTPPPQGISAPPPIPGAGQLVSPEDGVPAAGDIPEGAARLVRLMISAARADGELSDAERSVILEHARAAGAEPLVTAELARPTPIARIVEGVADVAQRQDLYVLAYGIVRADEGISGSEQIYLAQLAAILDLDRPTVERLERDAAARIERAAQEENRG